MLIPVIVAVAALAIAGFLWSRRSTPELPAPAENKPLPKPQGSEATEAAADESAPEPEEAPAQEAPAEEAETEEAQGSQDAADQPDADRDAIHSADGDAAEPEAEASEDEDAGDSPEADSEDVPADSADEPAEAPEPASTAPKSLVPSVAPKVDAHEALKKGLSNTRGGFISKLASLFKKKKEVDASLLDEVEEILITADIGVATADAILEGLRKAMAAGELQSADQVWLAIKEHARQILETPDRNGPLVLEKQPTLILVIGVNGVGKTTTIGKLSSRFQAEGKKVLLAAGDTFRAAAVLQLEVWGRRTGCEVVKGKDRADPSSVIFDAVKKGVEMGVDVIIADTAGRLHTKSNLMDELAKLGRTAEKALGRPADEIVLVLDSTTGQNAIQQLEIFKEALPINGLVLTKLDGTAKGGVILGIVDQHQIPVRYVGVGERVEDLRDFDSGTFVEALFANPEGESASA